MSVLLRFVAMRSDSSAASDGAVNSPSGHHDWSSVPTRNVRLPLSSGLQAEGREKTSALRQVLLRTNGSPARGPCFIQHVGEPQLPLP